MTFNTAEFRDNLREYFLMFGAPDPWMDRETYWDNDPEFWQVLVGILFLPIFAVIWIVMTFFTFRVKMGGTSSRKASPSIDANNAEE